MIMVEGDQAKFNSFVRGYTIPNHPLSGSCGYNGVSLSFLPFAAALSVGNGEERMEREWVVDAFLRGGLADVNEAGRSGWTALTYAVSVGNVKTIKILIDAGADVYVRDAQGRTLLDITHDSKVIGMIREALTTLSLSTINYVLSTPASIVFYCLLWLTLFHLPVSLLVLLCYRNSASVQRSVQGVALYSSLFLLYVVHMSRLYMLPLLAATLVTMLLANALLYAYLRYILRDTLAKDIAAFNAALDVHLAPYAAAFATDDDFVPAAAAGDFRLALRRGKASKAGPSAHKTADDSIVADLEGLQLDELSDSELDAAGEGRALLSRGSHPVGGENVMNEAGDQPLLCGALRGWLQRNKSQ
jgi:hypothetical protein